MVLQEVAQFLCQLDESQPLHRRAIALFGFQVAILSPAVAARESRARILAGLRILETLEKDLPQNANLKARLEVTDYSDVLDSIFREGGARKLRSLWSMKQFSDDISARLHEARDVARMVEFSHRFAKFGKAKPQQRAGPTMARHFVRKMTDKSDSTLKTRWREYGETAVLSYLMLCHHKNLKPLRLAHKDFVARLFKQAENFSELRAFFVAYVDLAKTLRPRGYEFEDLILTDMTSDAPTYELEPFSNREQRVIADYEA